ncbi:MAG: PhzF family phenazine biosynthesis protein [Chloroflexota bacterium]
MTNYKYYICDVFTDTRFGGNVLAVFPDARGLSGETMQKIAREFNFSESTFVFPPQQGHTRHVRIFTPTIEVPFAGHPNVGTAFVLAATGAFGEIVETKTITFEEEAGLVPIEIRRGDDEMLVCELNAPQAVSIGQSISVDLLATAVSLTPGDIVTTTHPPQVASVGLPFLIAELKDRDALARARINLPVFDEIAALGITPDIHLYTQTSDDFDIRCRMFAPLDNVPEDPATGSANCALVAMLTHHKSESDGAFRWRIAQGVEMGRPSVLDARTEKKAGVVTGTWIGGSCVMVADGTLVVE